MEISSPPGDYTAQPAQGARLTHRRTRRLTRDQLGLALPVARTQVAQMSTNPLLTSANAVKSDPGALSWRLVLIRRQASPLLTSNAQTWGVGAAGFELAAPRL
jgi:hypothetical protein